MDGAGDATYVVLRDDRGTVMGIADTAGNVVEKLFYNSTGLAKACNATGTALTNTYGEPVYKSRYVRLGWTGMHRDPFTGLYHTHFRDFDPLTNRWTSEDPAGYADGLNLYAAYFGVNGIDVLGTQDAERMHASLAADIGIPPEELVTCTYRLELPLLNSDIAFVKAQGSYTQVKERDASGRPTVLGAEVSPLAIRWVPSLARRVSDRTEARALGVYEAGGTLLGTAAAGVVIVAVAPEALPSGVVLAAGKILVLYCLVDSSGRLVEAIPVLVDENATPAEIQKACCSATLAVGTFAGVGLAQWYPRQVIQIDGYTVGPYSKVGSHHIVQNAAVRLIPGYQKGAAPAVDLGDIRDPLSPHRLTLAAQRMRGGGTFEAERRIAYRALRDAGVPQETAKKIVRHAGKYFRVIGVQQNTPTLVPGGRR